MTTDDQQPNESGGTMPILAHLSELRIRLIRIAIVLVVCILAAYGFRKEILDIVREPVEEPLKRYTASLPKETKKSPVLFDRDSFDCQCVEKEPAVIEADKNIDVPAIIASESSVEEAKDVTVDASEDTNKVGDAKAGITQEASDFKKKGPDIPEIDLDKPLIPGETAATGILKPVVLGLDCTCTQLLSAQEPKPVSVDTRGSSMVFLNLPEVFFAQMKVAIFAGFFLGFPYILLELWGFISPALFRSEKKVFWVFAAFTYICFTGGALFGYFIVFPFGFDFFLSLTQMGEIMPSLSIGEYLGLALKLLIAFGVVFEMPLVAFILARMGVLTPEWMLKNAKFAVLIIFIGAAMLTPPDPFTMLLMAGPLCILYVISILVAALAVNRKKVALRAQGFDDEDLDIDDE